MSRQNIFNNETFFSGYKALRDSDCNANDLIEQPAMRKLLPDLNGKSVLDLVAATVTTALILSAEVQRGLSALIYPKRCLPLQKKNPHTAKSNTAT